MLLMSNFRDEQTEKSTSEMNECQWKPQNAAEIHDSKNHFDFTPHDTQMQTNSEKDFRLHENERTN